SPPRTRAAALVTLKPAFGFWPVWHLPQCCEKIGATSVSKRGESARADAPAPANNQQTIQVVARRVMKARIARGRLRGSAAWSCKAGRRSGNPPNWGTHASDPIIAAGAGGPRKWVGAC